MKMQDTGCSLDLCPVTFKQASGCAGPGPPEDPLPQSPAPSDTQEKPTSNLEQLVTCILLKHTCTPILPDFVLLPHLR